LQLFPRRARETWAGLGLSAIFVNASSLVGTTVIGSGLGAVYWWVAAHLFTPTDVGIASAAISATLLLGVAGSLGTGTLLIGELPSRGPVERCRLIVTAVTVSGIAGGVLGIGYAIVAPYLSPELSLLGSSVAAVALCAATASLTAVGLVVDLALIGLLRGNVQLGRNALYAVSKLIILVPFAVVPFGDRALGIYFSWFAGTLLSFLAVLRVGAAGRLAPHAYRPEWGLLRRLGRTALEHHALNLSLQVPTLLMPLLVTVLLSASMNAYFYVASMVAALVFMIPAALSTALYAVGSHSPETFAHKIRLTLLAALVAGTGANLFFLVAAQPILGLFGGGYAQNVDLVLHLLLLAVFPSIVKTHFVAVCQTHHRVGRAAFLAAPGALVELIGAAIGAELGGLNGVAIGYIAALCVEAAIMAPVVLQAMVPGLALRGTSGWIVLPRVSGQ
jgi:O-antigen/teichoic acid export membrane protein